MGHHPLDGRLRLKGHKAKAAVLALVVLVCAQCESINQCIHESISPSVENEAAERRGPYSSPDHMQPSEAKRSQAAATIIRRAGRQAGRHFLGPEGPFCSPRGR